VVGCLLRDRTIMLGLSVGDVDAIQWRHKTEHEESKANAEVHPNPALISQQLADHDPVLTLVARIDSCQP